MQYSTFSFYHSMKDTLIRLFVFMTFLFQLKLNAQSVNDYSSVDKTALSIPYMSVKNTTDIAKYFNEQFNSDENKIRAIFIWLASNINYDIDNIYAINHYATTAEIISKTLSSRKAICQGYAETFNELCAKTGIKSFVITGYTKQSGFVDYIPHAWVTAFVGGKWRLYDPTWGAGFIQDAKFTRHLNPDYFDASPETLIKDHMPFDPLWQLLNPPLTSAEFYEHKTHGSGDPFNFNDSIKTFEEEDTIERINASIRRIESNGIKNSLIYDQLNYLHRELDFRKQSALVALYNSAVNKSNEAVTLFNKYIDFKNKQFTPKKTDEEIKHMIETPEKNVTDAKSILSAIQNPDPSLAANITSLNTMVNDMMNKINDEKKFIQKYFDTPKLMRKSLFYQPR